MFVLMGLSAVFPVLHGIELYGIHEMRDRMGLIWVVLQGFLYILGAGLYAVSHSKSRAGPEVDLLRLAGPNVHGQALLISGEARIRYSISLSSWPLHHIFTVYSRPSITITARLG
jgi:predicted membrane channel-forming protein YqfA (hemolysin III family)